MTQLVDETRRAMGLQASQALNAVEASVWERSSEVIRRAEALLEKSELTPEAALTMLISLLEQRRVCEGLRGQIKDGIRATQRVNARIDAQAERVRAEKEARLYGRNRFGRSKVPIEDEAS
jgi:hypothetical protein